MAQRLLIASSNLGKVAEFRALLEDSGFEIIAPQDLHLMLDIPETGDTFEANALLKGIAFAAASMLPSLADDSGLEVDALGGAPGIHSARFGGPDCSDADRVALLLERLAATPPELRTARFRCAVALCAPDGRVWKAEGVCEGRIEPAPRGSHGFGYDPVFLLPSLGRTMAELSAEAKNRLSHRARALAGLRADLERLSRGG